MGVHGWLSGPTLAKRLRQFRASGEKHTGAVASQLYPHTTGRATQTMQDQNTANEKAVPAGKLRRGFLKLMRWIEKGGTAQNPCRS